MGSEYNPKAEAEKTKAAGEGEKPQKRTMGERLRGALGSRKKADQDAGGGKGKVDKSAKGGGKVTTPRKAGGS